MEHIPDGRKAPVVEVLSGTFRTFDIQTQTPATNQDVQDGGGSTDVNNRSHSASPSYPIIAGPPSDSRPSSRCSSGGVAENEENVSPDIPTGPKYASSPKPNNSYQFAREPPDGAEKVPWLFEDADR